MKEMGRLAEGVLALVVVHTFIRANQWRLQHQVRYYSQEIGYICRMNGVFVIGSLASTRMQLNVTYGDFRGRQ